MSVALENARLFDETTRLLKETDQRAAELSIINSVQQGLASKLDVQSVYDLVGDKIRSIFDAQSVLLTLFDQKLGIAHDRYCYEKGQRFYSEPQPFTNFMHHLIRTRQVVLINEGAAQRAAEYGMQLTPGTEMARSMLFVPLIAGDEVRGLISLQNIDRENAFSDSDVRLLTTLASSMSVALENARLFDETERLLKETEQRAAELAIINSVQEGLASKLDYQSIIKLVGEKVGEVFAADTTYIAQFDAQTQLFHFPYYVDKGVQLIQRELPLGRGLTSAIFNSHQPLLLGTGEEQVKHGGVSDAYQDGLVDRNQTYLGVPILIGNEAKGIISVQRYPQHAYDESHVRLLQTLANSMSVALENARLFDETQRLLKETDQRVAELAIINSVQQGLASKLDMQSIYDLVGDKIRDIFDAQVVMIVAYDHAAKLMHFPFGLEKGQRLTAAPRPPAGFSGYIIRTRQPLLINQNLLGRLAEIDPANASTGAIAGEMPKSWLGVPLISGEEMTGVISLQNIDRENAYSDSDLRLLTTLASSMSVALENARLFDETQRLLKETDQRAAELAIINSVQQGLASKLDMQSIYELVGDKPCPD